jgi:hypothetical protein
LKHTEEDKERFVTAPFDTAAYVHPFRHPSYHATQLRAIAFAKNGNKQLLWVTAHDALVDKALVGNSAREEARKEHWLEFHDRFTGNIPGLLPLVLDLPIRFTDTIDKCSREQGIFKHARGVLRGWKLPDEEVQRVQELNVPEMVLKQRPLQLFIEVPTGTKVIPLVDGKKIFILKVQRKQWVLDKSGVLKIVRYGFPIVPDFGGTAHAYCGSTLDAVLGDLLPWYKTPCLEDMLRAYIIRSRMKEADKIILVQPYNPHLFRQGLLPGPQLLLDVLLKSLRGAEAKKAWREHEAQKKDKANEKKKGWDLFSLPCRRCTDNNAGVEVWKHIEAFGSSSRTMATLQRDVLSKGQDLCCLKCQHHLKWIGKDSKNIVVLCDICERGQPVTHFNVANQDMWRNYVEDVVTCKKCLGEKDDTLHFCNGVCQRDLPEFHFVDGSTAAAQLEGDSLALKCARCTLGKSNEKANSTLITCAGCKLEKHIPAFTVTVIKRFLSTGHHTNQRDKCNDCVFPACAACTEENRPMLKA